MIIQTKAYAKINLYLKILNKLPTGYHNIKTVMQKISLFDDIKINIKNNNKRNIKIKCSEAGISNETNTAYKAADLFLTHFGLTADIEITIGKNIPSQAGLGGGSSDAAAVLLSLNKYFDFALSEKELIWLAAKIGADVPFFAADASCAVCEGIGDIVKPVETALLGFFCLIVKPAYNISTKQAFNDFDDFRKSNRFFEFEFESDKYKNDFAALAFSQNEDLKTIRGLILNSGASESELSGSGSALFGIFRDISDAQKCKNMLNRRNGIEFCDIFDFI